MAGYDPKKAAEYNKLIQQGVAPEAAIVQAGITYEESGNYEINSVGTSATNRDYGRMSDIAVPQNNTSGVNPASDPSQFPAYDDDGNLQPGFAINDENGGTYYRGFPSQDVGTALPVSDPYYGLTPTQLQDLGGADPTDPYIRARLGIPQLPGSTLFATGGFGTIKTGVPAIDSALGIIGGSITSLFSNFSSTIGGLFGPKPTATAVASTTGMSVAGLTTPTPTPPTTDTPVNPASDPSQFPAYDDDGNLQPGFAVNDETGGTYYQGFERSTDQPVNPASDPSQFPAYDDDGNLQPGFAINDETGGTYYQGFERNTDQPFQADLDPEYSYYSVAGLTEPEVSNPATVNDPYYGLTPTQLQDLGGADPTDPYIRARLGIPQLPDSTLAATPGFGTIKTGVPIIDSALSFLGGLFGSKPAAPPTPAAPPVSPTSDPSQFPAYDDDGNLQPGFAINEETGETYYQGFERSTDQPVNPASDPSQFPAYDDDGNLQPGFAINDETGETYYQGVGPATQQSSVNPASDPSQFPAYDDDGNLQPGFAVNDETGETYFQGVGPATGTDSTTLSAEQADAFYNGTGTPTAAQQAETNAQTAADAAALYPGTNNTNLKNINDASAAIAQNEAGIANAQDIIAQNNAELADPDISDERRAELEANNASQENYIRLAESNTGENELIIESNADSFAAGGGDPDSGQGPLEVAALEDPGLETTEAILEPDPDATFPEDVDPAVDEELVAQEELQQDQVDGVVESDSPTEVSPEEDPFEAARLEAEQNLADEQPVEFAPEDVPFLTDAEADALAEQQAENQRILAEEATDVEPGLFNGQTDEFGGVDEAVAIQQADIDTRNDPALSEDEIQAELDQAVESNAAEDVDTNEDDGLKTPDGQEETGEAADTGLQEPTDADVEQANQEAAVRDRAKQQATFQARYKQSGNADWRVRLSLGPNAQYLYNAGAPAGTAAGILAPLAATDGVIFPYTPSITTTYTANYEQYDLVHSNYRGIYYKNSRVGDIQIRGTFTAQDTKEADYLLAVIHFFRSATKMFYGQDAERGTPPPVCLLNGLGQYQFSDHPVVISSFNYTLPNDVDYIRAGSPNNYGVNMLNRRAAVASNPGGQSLAGLNRLTNALLKKGAPGQGVPDPSAIQQNVSNTAGASYVPTKIEIDITLIPVQTRSQVSKQFSLKGFANGQLLKGGFW